MLVTRRRLSPPGEDPDRDPTGVQSLLSNLPQPGPLPDDLAARINASLAQEHRDAPGPGVVHGFDDSLRVGRPSRWPAIIATAAAALVAGLVGSPLLFPHGLRPFATGEDAATLTAGARSAPGAAIVGAGATPAAPAAGVAPLVLRSGRDYDGGDLAGQSRWLLRADRSEAATTGVPDDTTLARCLTHVVPDPAAAGPTGRVVVDVARVDGRPALVILIDRPAGAHVLAAPGTCGTGPTTRPLRAPVPAAGGTEHPAPPTG